MYIFVGSIEVKLPTTWTHGKQRWQESEKEVRRKQIKQEKVRRKMLVRDKVGKPRTTVFFNDLWLRELDK